MIFFLFVVGNFFFFLLHTPKAQKRQNAFQNTYQNPFRPGASCTSSIPEIGPEAFAVDEYGLVERVLQLHAVFENRSQIFHCRVLVDGRYYVIVYLLQCVDTTVDHVRVVKTRLAVGRQQRSAL